MTLLDQLNTTNLSGKEIDHLIKFLQGRIDNFYKHERMFEAMNNLMNIALENVPEKYSEQMKELDEIKGEADEAKEGAKEGIKMEESIVKKLKLIREIL